MIGTVIYLIITQLFKLLVIKVICKFFINVNVKEEFGWIIDSIKFLLIFYNFFCIWIQIGILFNTIIIVNDIFI